MTHDRHFTDGLASHAITQKLVLKCIYLYTRPKGNGDEGVEDRVIELYLRNTQIHVINTLIIYLENKSYYLTSWEYW